MKPLHSTKEKEAKKNPLQPLIHGFSHLCINEPMDTSENQSTMEVSNDCRSKQYNTNTSLLDSGPASSSNKKKVKKEDIQIVQILIEGCLVEYMNRNEVIKTLCDRDCIDPVFTTLVWQKLEEQNAEFFRDYCIRLELIKQIGIFNQFLRLQYDMMQNFTPPNAPVTPIQNRMDPIPAADHFPQPAGINSDFISKVMETSSVEVTPVIPSSSSDDTATLDGSFLGLPDLTYTTNIPDIWPLENYPRSPFLPSYPNIDSPELFKKYFTYLGIVNELKSRWIRLVDEDET